MRACRRFSAPQSKENSKAVPIPTTAIPDEREKALFSLLPRPRSDRGGGTRDKLERRCAAIVVIEGLKFRGVSEASSIMRSLLGAGSDAGTQLAKFQAPGEGRAVFLEWSGRDAEQDALQGSAGWRKLEEEKKEIRNPPNLGG